MIDPCSFSFILVLSCSPLSASNFKSLSGTQKRSCRFPGLAPVERMIVNLCASGLHNAQGCTSVPTPCPYQWMRLHLHGVRITFSTCDDCSFECAMEANVTLMQAMIILQHLASDPILPSFLFGQMYDSTSNHRLEDEKSAKHDIETLPTRSNVDSTLLVQPGKDLEYHRSLSIFP